MNISIALAKTLDASFNVEYLYQMTISCLMSLSQLIQSIP